MPEYISREATAKAFCEKCKGYYDGHCVHRGECDIDVIQTAPAADVQSIKKGHWYHNTSKYISELDAYFIQACCSCCGKYSDRVDLYSTIMSNEMCSHCGARMDGDQND